MIVLLLGACLGTSALWAQAVAVPLELPAAVLQATRDALAKPSAGQVAAARQRMADALSAVEAQLAKYPNAVSLGQDMGLALLREDLSAERPATEQLDAAYDRLRHSRWQMPKEAGAELRDAVTDYAAALRRGLASANETAPLVDRMDQAWRQFAQQPTAERFDTVREAVQQLSRLGAADAVLSWLDLHASYPNQWVLVARPDLERMMSRPIKVDQPVDTVSQGARIRGRVTGEGVISASLPPNSENSELHVHFSGTATERFNLTKGIASINVNGTTQLQGHQPYQLSAGVLGESKPDIRLGMQLRTGRVSLAIRSCVVRAIAEPIAQRIAQRKLAEKQPELRRYATKAIADRVDLETRGMVLQLNRLAALTVWNPLNDLTVIGRPRFQTTDRELIVSTRFVTPTRGGAPTLPPELPAGDYGRIAQLHESSIDNTSNTIARRDLTESLVHETLFDMIGLQEPETTTGPRMPSTLRLASRDPVRARFRQETATARWNIQGYQQGTAAFVSAPCTIRAEYTVRLVDGQLKLERSALSIEPGDAAYAAEVRGVSERFFPATLASRPKAGGSSSASHTRMSYVKCDNGWLSLGWEREHTDQPLAQAEATSTSSR
ncbi:MAG: hypothetical protein JSS27_06405 [Planctomycetes bacterium]|nr:hypothetical protein [Planctomycetota bacterium]